MGSVRYRWFFIRFAADAKVVSCNEKERRKQMKPLDQLNVIHRFLVTISSFQNSRLAFHTT
jgi:hypothetical protein